MKTEEYHDALKDALKSVQKVRLIVGANHGRAKQAVKSKDPAVGWTVVRP